MVDVLFLVGLGVSAGAAAWLLGRQCSAAPGFCRDPSWVREALLASRSLWRRSLRPGLESLFARAENPARTRGLGARMRDPGDRMRGRGRLGRRAGLVPLAGCAGAIPTFYCQRRRDAGWTRSSGISVRGGLVALAVESGLHIEWAVRACSPAFGGLLKQEMARLAADRALGRSWTESLREFASRGLRAGRTAVNAVIQAEAGGMSLGPILRTFPRTFAPGGWRRRRRRPTGPR